MCSQGLSVPSETDAPGTGQGRDGRSKARHAVPALPRPSFPLPPPLTLTLLWNVCSRVCTPTQEGAVNAAGAWPPSAERGGPQSRQS